MWELIGYLFIFLVVVVICYISVKQTIWVFSRKNQITFAHETIRTYLHTQGLKVQSLQKPTGELKKKNPFNTNWQIALPGIFASGEMDYYWVAECKSKDAMDIRIWIKEKQSLYARTKFEYIFQS